MGQSSLRRAVWPLLVIEPGERRRLKRSRLN
jgi:hypothetical protein